MAKKAAKQSGDVNKSQAIRDELKKNPAAKPKELSAELTARGIDVSAAYVSTIKTGMKTKSSPRRASAASSTGSTLVASDLMETKKLVDKVGSIEYAEALLGTLKKLR